MQIDWLTVLAQIVNFLVLVILLKKFLYRPILQSMALREQTIADQQRKAVEAQSNAERQAEIFEAKQREIELQRDAMHDSMQHEIETKRLRMLEKLRLEIDQNRSSWYSELSEEKNAVLAEIKILLGDQIIQMSRKVLKDLANADLEQQIINRFLEQLTELPAQAQQQMADAVSKNGRINILSHFKLSDTDKARIEQSLSRLQPGLQVKYSESPDIICGIILETEGYIWPWSAERYLEGLEDLFGAAAVKSGSYNNDTAWINHDHS